MGEARVVVTGVGVLAPNGAGRQAFTAALRSASSGITQVALMREAGMACQVAGLPVDFAAAAAAFFEPHELQALDRTTALATVAALQCWCDGGFAVPAEGDLEVDWDTGVIFGAGMPGIQSITDVLVPRVQERQIRRLGSSAPQRCMASGAPALISGLLGIGGTAFAVSSACASGSQAIALGFDAIRRGDCVRVLAGGADADSVHAWAGFDAMKLLARHHNDAPERASRPMSASASGFVPAAGGCFLLLEHRDAARAREARVYAELSGVAFNAGGHRNGGSMTAANPEGIQRCIHGALRRANVQGNQIDLINGHLTGTQADVSEVSGWAHALGLNPNQMPPVQATKGLIGHSLGAAGAIESAAAVLQIADGFIHANRNCEDLHPALQAYRDACSLERQDRPVAHVAKASFGFGDVNTCLVFSADGAR